MATNRIRPSSAISNALRMLNRILPSTFRSSASQVEISNPVALPAWVKPSPWLVDSRGSVFIRLA